MKDNILAAWCLANRFECNYICISCSRSDGNGRNPIYRVLTVRAKAHEPKIYFRQVKFCHTKLLIIGTIMCKEERIKRKS